MKLLLTCEHYSNRIPAEFRHLFDEKADLVINSHRAYDIGSAQLLHNMEHLADAQHRADFSRLLIDVNHSIPHRHLYSPFTMAQASELKTRLMAELYFPYRKRVEDNIEKWLNAGEEVTHIALHTFAPRQGSSERRADIGLLYDPQRTREQEFCRAWKKEMLRWHSRVRVRSNFPYRGTSDRFTDYLRKRFSENYAGIELEVKNTMVPALRDMLRLSLAEIR